MVCSECGQNVYDGMRLNTSTLYAMQFIVGTPVEKLYTFTLSDEVLKELGKLWDVIWMYTWLTDSSRLRFWSSSQG